MTGTIRTIDAADVPGSPPYKVTAVWSGRHGPWHLDVTRVGDDPLPHAVALHLGSGLVHAERVDVTTPKAVKLWADGLPVTVAVTAGAA